MKDMAATKIGFSENAFCNLIFIPVTLNGVRMTALFDTGAAMSFVTASAAAQAGIVSNGGTVTCGNNNGEILQNATGELEYLQIADRKIREIAVGILPDAAFDFGTDEQGNTFPASMILGWDILSQFCWILYMGERAFRVEEGGTMPQSNTLKWDQFPIVTVGYEGEEIPIGFDSGHTDTMLDASWQSRIPELQAAVTMLQGVGSAAEETVWLANTLKIRMSGVWAVLQNVEVMNREICGAAQGRMFGLLGADVIAGKNWVIDAKSHCFEIFDTAREPVEA